MINIILACALGPLKGWKPLGQCRSSEGDAEMLGKGRSDFLVVNPPGLVLGHWEQVGLIVEPTIIDRND